MPRKERIDAPGALHHIIARGTDGRSIFEENTDRTNFLSPVDSILSGTRTVCYVWALIPNHFHLFFQIPGFILTIISRGNLVIVGPTK